MNSPIPAPFLNQVKLASWHWHVATDVVTWSPELYALFGLDPTGPPPSFSRHPELYTPESFEILKRAVERCLETGEPFCVQLEGRRADGTQIFTDGHGSAHRDGTGKIVSLYGVTIDRTEEKATARERQELGERLFAMLESTSDGVVLMDHDWKVTYVNRVAELLLERERSALLRRCVWEEFPEIIDSTFYKQCHRAAAENVTVRFESRYEPVGRWFEVSAHPSTQGLSVFLHDITDRKSNEEALLLVTNRLKLATSAANIGIWDWDTVQNKLVWDDKMYDIYGVSPETFDKSYTTWFAMVHPEDQERVETNVATTFDGLSNYNAVFRIIRPDGSIRYIKATGLAQFDQDSRPIRMLGTNADVTPQIELQAKLEKALQDAKSANEAKSQFLAMMSHEIRTPMNAVVGFCDLLVQTALTEDQVDFVTSIQKAGASLTEIIDGILDFSKIEAGKLELRREPCNLRTLIDEVYDLLSPAAWLRGLSFRKNVDPNLPALMMGDPGAIKRVLTNLIGNAIKFTDVGQVIVDAGVQEDDGKQVVQIDVLDTGIGVSDEMQGQLFRPFSQGDRSNKRRFGGTGLGLAISRSLAEGMGGTLTMRSRQEGGSEFRFMFPVIPFDGGNDEPHVSSSETPDSASEIRLHNGPTVLLVEDNTVNRRLMGHFLKRLGCSFDAVEDGEQAVRALRDKQYAAVLMDIQMPVMDGWEATAAIRELEASNPDRPRSYIIAQSAHASGDDIRKCLAAGMDDYLSKPMTLSALSQALARAAASEAKR